jgi:cytochrome c biogenesis factor
MLSEIGRLALALGALFGAWAAIAGLVALRGGHAAVARAASRGARAATACAIFALFVLALATYAGDTRVAFVAGHSSVLMPARLIPVALLSNAGAALPALAALIGIVGLIVESRASATPAARLWPVMLTGGVTAISLGVATQLGPLMVRSAGAVDGRGLAPELQHTAAVVQGLALLAGTALAFGAFAITAAGLASRAIGDAWSRAIRPWNATAFIALSLGLVASACGAALYPVREPWLSDRTTTVWLMAVLTSAWLTQLDRGRQGADRAVMRLLLSGVVFIAATAALALTGATFVNPVVAGMPGAASFFGLVPVGAVSVLIGLLRDGKGALADARTVTNEPRHRVALGLVIAGVVLLAGSAIGSAWTRSHSAAIGDTEIFRVRDPLGTPWSFRSQGISTLKRENFASFTLTLLVDRDSTRVGLVSAEARSYLLADDRDAAPPIAVSGVRHGALLDMRIAIAEPDGSRPTIRVAFVPLASWLWPGASLLWLGVLLYVLPRPRARA